MKTEPFVHLHLHTCFSLLDGACRIDPIMDAAARNNMPAVAITDHGVMYGIIDFYKAARAKGIKPILGSETYIAKKSRFDRKSDRNRSQANHLVLLATNDNGYHNLVKLVTAAHLEGFYYKPRIDKEILAEHSDGLIGLSACLKGEVASHLMNEDMDGAMKAVGTYTDILGKDNFFLEVQDHNLPEQRKVNAQLKDLSQKTGIPIVATNDVHYLEKEHASAHEVLLCLQTQTVMSDPKRMRYRSEEFYMKTRDQMESLFREFPGALDLTLDIAERCNVELEFDKLHFPSFHAPNGKTQKTYLLELGLDGIKSLYHVANPERPKNDKEREIIDRFHHEMNVIDETGFINYFLVVWDFVRFARENGIMVGPGRGSGGGSLLAYVLGITTIDPLHYNLIFERFLNPERVSPPDFDIDFCQERRGEVIEYVKEKYGRENVAQIITFGSLGAKTVIRDVGRVLEIPYGKCDQLSKMVPDDPKITLELALDTSPEFRHTYESDDDCKRILDYAFVLQGLYRNAGTHAAGVVIGEKPLVEIIPLSLDKEKQPITQYTMEPLGKIGLLKMDFLGLKTLTVIREAIELVERIRGEKIALEQIPFDNPKTYELLSRGDTIGVFQLESAGMRDLVRRVGLNRIEDLIAMIALYRPGPMNMLPAYVDRKSGKATVRYEHSLMEPILEETYGVMIYQEQVQAVAHTLAGYSLGEGDILRRAMGKKNPIEMEQQRATFIEGAKKESQIDPKPAGKIFDSMAEFAGYGFNKAHSTGYAIISYQTAYLKANYPAEFMSALLSSEIGNFDKLPVFISETGEMGLQILPPDVNKSAARFVPEEDGIRFGLAGIKNVGEGAASAVVVEHEKNGNYEGLVNLCSRLDNQLVNRKAIESLIRAGALDGMETHRARLFNGIEFAMARASNMLADRKSGQGSLFDLMDEPSENVSSEELPDCEPWHESELLSAEKELLGIYLSGHPLTRYASLLQRYQLTTVEALSKLGDNTLTRLGGIVAQIQKKITKTKKENMAIVHLEDLDGCVEVLVFPEAYQEYGIHLTQDAPILVCGEVSLRDDQPKIIAQEVYPLEEAPKHFATRLSLHVPATAIEDGRLEKIKDGLRMHPGPTPVVICLQFPAGEKVFIGADDTFNVFPTEELIHKLEHELGETGVYVSVNSTACKNGHPQRRKWPRNKGNSS